VSEIPEQEAPPEVGSLLRRGSIYTVASVIQLSAFVLVLPAITRILPASDFGEMTAALVVVQILAYVASLGLPYAITLEFFVPDRGHRDARALVLISTAFAVVIAAVLDVTGDRWVGLLFDQISYSTAIRCAVWATVPFAAVLAGQSLLRSADQAARFVAVAMVATVGAQGAGLLTAVLGSRTAGSFMVGYLAVLSVAGVLAIVLPGIDSSHVRDLPLLRRALHLGLPTVPHALAMYLLVAGDRIIIEHRLGSVEVARYQVAYLVGALGITLAGSVNNAWSPVVYGAVDERRWMVLAHTEAALTRLAGFVAAGLAVAAPFLLALLAPASYNRADLVPVVAVVALTVLPYVDYLAHGHVIFFERRAWLFALITPAVAGLNLVLNMVLVDRFELIGSAAATLVSYLALAAGTLVARHRMIGADRSWGTLGLGWSIGIAGALAGTLMPVSATGLAVRGGLLVVLVAGGLYVLRDILGGRWMSA
jgi:O-antigen/teichoic acid export membrane protein